MTDPLPTSPSVRSSRLPNPPKDLVSPDHEKPSVLKRAYRDEAYRPQASSESGHKKRRIASSHLIRDRIQSLAGKVTPSSSDAVSPLFFSQHDRVGGQRPSFPPRFSSGEAAERMLSKAHADENNIKTVTLARGSYSDFSPPVPRFLSLASRSTSEKSSVLGSGSPDGIERSETLRLLGQIGIIELLEQDARPTFIIDLSDTLPFVSGALQVLFANGALRSIPASFDMVRGHADPQVTSSNSPTSTLRFQAWVLAAAASSDSLEGSPSFPFAGLLWSRSTLRRRLRVVSAASAVTPAPEVMPSTAKSLFADISRNAHTQELTGGRQQREPSDYFGNAIPSDSERRALPEVPAALVQTPDPVDMGDSLFGTIREQGQSDLLRPFDSPRIANDCKEGEADGMDHILSPGSPPRDVGFFDWTRLPVSDDMPRHIRFARNIDWGSTALGPIEFWSPDLRQMCNLVMASPHPAAMYWGDDLVAIYNEAYIMLAGQKHPSLMGLCYRDAWAEIWDDVKDVFANARQTGQATMKDDDRLFMKRSNYLEEVYFSWSIIPMVGPDGAVSGLYNPAFEKTRRKIAERRMLTLREVGEQTASARDVRSFWRRLASALESNEEDTPFLLLYSVSDDNDSDTSSVHSSSHTGTKQCYLEGALGVPNGHSCAPTQIDLKGGIEGFGPVFREVLKTDKTVLLRVRNSKEGLEDIDASSPEEPDPEDLTDAATLEIPSEMLDGLEWRGFGDPCRAVVVCPVHPTTGESGSILGFLVLGVNPRRPYDEDYSLFVQLLSRQLATSLASVVLFEEEIKRGQKAAKLAALDRIELSEQLAARTKEARDIESRFTRMAEFSPAGLFIADSKGHITYCNDTWYDIAGIPKDPVCADNWIDYVMESDQDYVRGLWAGLVEHAKPVTSEFRFKSQWRDENGNKSDTWVLFSAYPERSDSDDTQFKSVFGNITDISSQKWAQGFQKRKMEEAVELKRQQENFIDITSHEMRNPLTAILQCADEVSASLGDIDLATTSSVTREAIESSIDAAKTIVLCSQHQKRIVDDVLTMSKLDSKMLLIAPVDVQPLTIVQRALKMFESETQSAGIDMKLVVDDSFEKLRVDWVRCDPQRVVQVLINLTTNAMKFTSNSSGIEGSISVKISASRKRPRLQADAPVQYFRSQIQTDDDLTAGPDWGDGEELYIQFAVQDTGPGLTPEEKKILFKRFTQASPRTHVQYGGSGLGLFISRELTELQGGEIGVASEA